MRWARRPPLPADVRRGLSLAAGERVLAYGRCTDGSWAVATDRALVYGGERLDWVDISHADWDDKSGMLTVEVLGAARQPAATRRLAFDDAGFLPETVRERVLDSIVASRHAAVRGRSGVQVVARRSPTSDGLQWQVMVDAGLDPDDAQVQALAGRLLAELRADLGE